MKIYETNKLFYEKYFYKLRLRNSLAVYFREKNLPLTRQVLDKLQQQKENSIPLEVVRGLRQYYITDQDFSDAKKLYAAFSNFEDYKLRVEQMYLNVYSDNKQWIEGVLRSVSVSSLSEFWEPSTDNIELLEKNVILVPENTGYEYKVTFGSKKGEPEFASWAKSNPKQIKIGPVCYKELQTAGFVNGMYFYARDEKTLHLCNLMTANIRRIDKLIVKANIDK